MALVVVGSDAHNSVFDDYHDKQVDNRNSHNLEDLVSLATADAYFWCYLDTQAVIGKDLEAEVGYGTQQGIVHNRTH